MTLNDDDMDYNDRGLIKISKKRKAKSEKRLIKIGKNSLTMMRITK